VLSIELWKVFGITLGLDVDALTINSINEDSAIAV
jgi:hypothetical protein